MKQYRSRFLKTVSLFYMSFPLTFVAASAVTFDVPARACLSLILSPSYLLISILAIFTGYGFWEMKRWGWYLFVGVNIMIAYLCAVVVNNYGETHYKAMTFVFSLIVLFSLSYRVAKEIRVPYFFPKIRWWESDPRYRLSVPVTLTRSDGGDPLKGDILDLSMGGCFVKLRNEMNQDDSVKLEFTLFKFLVKCEGTIVWRTQSTVTHPKGIGVKFFELERSQKRALKQVYRRLKRITQLYKSSRYLISQEEFIKRLEEIETAPLSRRKKKVSG